MKSVYYFCLGYFPRKSCLLNVKDVSLVVKKQKNVTTK